MANMVNTVITFAMSFLTPCFVVHKCGMYHLYHIFTPQYLHICKEQIFANPFFHPVIDV